MSNALAAKADTSVGMPRPVWPALARGWACRCPQCGQGRIFGAYLKVAPQCSECGTEFHHHRADDAPPYFTMMVVGHVVIGLLLVVERRFSPELWLQLVLWLPLTVVMSLLLLPRIKGMLICYQWALRMHGFGIGNDPAAPDPMPEARG